jgi:PAS domain S-box-containing protein
MANETILIVEDDGIIAAHLQDTLTGLGYRALGPVASGEAAIAAVKAQPPDMVLMDIRLAGPMDGISAAGRIQSDADIPIVYLTCYSQDPLLQQAKVTAPYGYLVKPVGERELAATLEMALYRHSLDRRLRESEELFRELFNHMSSGVAIYEAIDNGGDFIFKDCNPAVEKIEKVSRKDILGKRVSEVFPGVKAFGVFAVFQRVWQTGKSEYFPENIYKDERDPGSWRESRVFKLPTGEIVAIYNDITERKRAESQREAALEALRRTEENFRRSLDESPLGIRIVTAKGKTIYANRTLLDFYDYDSVAELNQTILRERYTPESYEEYKKRKKARDQGRLGPGEYEVSIVRKNGEVRYLQVFRKAILWNGENQFQVLYRDISESRQWLEKFSKFEKTIRGQKMLLDQQSASVEELIERLTRSREDLGASYRELKVKKDDLVRSEKLAFTGRMAAGIAHEIRNPLTNIILSLRQLKKDEKIKPKVLNYVEIMERNTNRIEYLITELLNCARPIKLNLQPGDIHLLIKDILSVHKVRLKTQKIKVIRNLTAHPSILLFDKEQLGRVFLNLIANAIDAMSKGGTLSIATKSEMKKFVVKIQDSGSGIPEKNLIKVFDPFFSTKKGGAGLGLSTCQNIVASHGGLIEVESAWRKGSVFSVSLPFEPKLLNRKENMAGES